MKKYKVLFSHWVQSGCKNFIRLRIIGHSYFNNRNSSVCIKCMCILVKG